MPPIPAPGSRPPAMLCVDDEVLILGTIVDAFEDAGYSTLAAGNSGCALAFLGQVGEQEICGLITDINLNSPMNGWQVARAAREQLQDLPVIYVSGTDSHDWEAEGVLGSVMISKPFDPSQVVARMKSLIGLHTD